MNELINAYYEYLTMFGESPHDIPSPELRSTISKFIDKKVNFATVKFKLDNLEDESYPVPSQEATASMSKLVLNLDLDELEVQLRTLMELPEDMNDAKGKLLDFEEYLGNYASNAGSWPELAACFWHLQAPEEWPVVNSSSIRYLQKNGEVGRGDGVQNCIECIMAMNRLSDETGISSAALATLMYALTNEVLEPSEGDISDELLDYAKTCDEAGDLESALMLYEILLHLKPDSDLMMRKSEIYESQGLIMAAIGEAESAVELKPESMKCHKRLLLLYKSKKMVKEFNAEVKRYEPIWEKKKAKKQGQN